MVRRPESGTTRPTTDRTNVVFPAPLGPRRPRISPSRTSSETPSSARTEAKDLRRSVASRGRGIRAIEESQALFARPRTDALPRLGRFLEEGAHLVGVAFAQGGGD